MSDKYRLFVCLILFLSCGSASKIPTENESELAKVNTDEIVFVIFKMQKDDLKSKIELVSSSKSTGRIKPETERSIRTGSSLTLEISQNGALLRTISIEHPLHKNVEYPDDNNRYQSTLVEPEEAEFFIRFQKKSGSAKIRVYEILKDKKNELQTFTL